MADREMTRPGHLAQKRNRTARNATSTMGSERKNSSSAVATSAQLRHGIATGQSGDKTSNIDPAAAPLGTDDEAAGKPPSTLEINLAAQEEVKNDPIPSQSLERSPIIISSSAGNRYLDRRDVFGFLEGLHLRTLSFDFDTDNNRIVEAEERDGLLGAKFTRK
jgi:hypothetical protein